MGLSPEGPPDGGPPAAAPPPHKEGDIIGFVIGLVIGLPVGGTVLTLLFLIIVAGVVQLLLPSASGDSTRWMFLGGVPALALGWWAVVMSRKAMNFFTGALIGLAAGLLGGTALCALMMGGLSNMH